LIGLVEILFGVALGVLLFGEVMSPGIWLGGALIVLAASLPSLAEMRLRRGTFL
jgi:drug/metabolite transporter (DMT)-like permease